MKQNFLLLSLFSLFILFTGCKTNEHSNLQHAYWKGTVSAGDDSVTVYLFFDPNLFGNLQGELSIPGQSLHDIKAFRCSITRDSLHLEFTGMLNAQYKAKLSGSTLKGNWVQAGHRFTLNLAKTTETPYQYYVTKALNLAERNSVYKHVVNWPQLRQEAMKLSQEAGNSDEIVPSFQLILRRLNDKHGFMQFNNKYIRNEIDDHPKAGADLKKAAFGHTKKVVAKRLNASIGYLRVPAFTEADSVKREEFNQQLQQQICQLAEENVTDWVIDLRLNEGGTMFPMLGGLNQLLGEEEIGSYTDSDEKRGDAWALRNGNFYNGDEQTTTSGKICDTRTKPGKIAVLIGPLTASSGEAVAVAFKSMQNTKFFGESTRARSTSVPGYGIGKDLIFFFSTGYFTDRNGQVYKNGISPDVSVTGGDNFANIEHDSKVTAALKWIQQ